MLEVETYRRLAEQVVGARIERIRVLDPHCLAGGLPPDAFARALTGRRVTGTRRVGKLLVVDTDGPALGLRFGMTGGLLLGGVAAIDRLTHGPRAPGARWVRLELDVAGHGVLALHDPRRFGRAGLDPDLASLGPDAAGVTAAQLGSALAGRHPGGGPPLKARLLDQARLAGLGNLLADEILWRAGLSPRRPSGSLVAAERARLRRTMARTLDQLAGRGGSHTGDLMAERRRGGRCPRDGTELTVSTVGGRTTYWCAAHQH
jgi:formamidopyrimidine-DNA glycosylase